VILPMRYALPPSLPPSQAFVRADAYSFLLIPSSLAPSLPPSPPCQGKTFTLMKFVQPYFVVAQRAAGAEGSWELLMGNQAEQVFDWVLESGESLPPPLPPSFPPSLPPFLP